MRIIEEYKKPLKGTYGIKLELSNGEVKTFEFPNAEAIWNFKDALGLNHSPGLTERELALLIR